MFDDLYDTLGFRFSIRGSLNLHMVKGHVTVIQCPINIRQFEVKQIRLGITGLFLVLCRQGVALSIALCGQSHPKSYHMAPRTMVPGKIPAVDDTMVICGIADPRFLVELHSQGILRWSARTALHPNRTIPPECLTSFATECISSSHAYR